MPVGAGGEGAELFAVSDELFDPAAAVVGGAIEGTGVALDAGLGDGVAAEDGAVATAGAAFVARGPSGTNARRSASGSTDGIGVV